MTRRLALVLCSSLILTAFVVSPASGGAAPLLKIKMFSGLGKDLPYAFSQRMSVPVVGGTPTIKVTTGTVLRFNGGPILLPQGVEPGSWRAEYGTGFDQPFSVLDTDPDPDLPGFVAPSKVNLFLFDPTKRACGKALTDPCDYDGSNTDPVAGVLNGGDSTRAFFVRITAPTGTTLWATHQLYSAPLADLKIDIVGGESAATTQAEIDAAFAEQKAADTEEARNLVEALEQPTFEEIDGKRVYDAYPGYDTETTSLLKMFPSRLTIRKGDTVNWHFDVLHGEVHTASFPFKKAKRISNHGFLPACDKDGDEGNLPDREATFGPDGPPCKPGQTFEGDLNRKMTAQFGDGVFPGGPKKYENSGLRGPVVPSGDGVAGGTADWSLKFGRRSGDSPFRYMCELHGDFMSGKVEVR